MPSAITLDDATITAIAMIVSRYLEQWGKVPTAAQVRAALEHGR